MSSEHNQIDYGDLKRYREAMEFVDELCFKLHLLNNPDFLMMPNYHILRWKEREEGEWMGEKYEFEPTIRVPKS